MPRKTSPLSPLGMQIEAVRARKERALGQLAVDADLNYSQLYRIMHGGSKPSRESLMRICRALDCTPEEIEEIFAESDWRKPSPEELEGLPEDRLAIA